MIVPLLVLFLALPVAGSLADPYPVDDDLQCSAPSEYLKFDAALPGAKASVAQHRRLDIVALGSSTTQGTGSSGSGSDYPSQLQEQLSQRLPGVTVTVWNRGVGGQTARQMLERLSSDAIELGPNLVIWQTGVNDAISGVPIGELKDILRHGIRMLRAHGIDTILMDLQYYPGSFRLPDYRDYVEAMQMVAREEAVPIFRRFDIMKYWMTSGQFEMAEPLSRDGLHMVDRSYHCLAVELAEAIAADLR